MRRLDALAPYKFGIEGIAEWVARDPMAAAAINRLEINSMRFMLEAAGIDSEGPVGAMKLQGLVIAWARILRTWFRDDDRAFRRRWPHLIANWRAAENSWHGRKI